MILPGIELSADDGHFLVFGVEKPHFGTHRTEYLRHVVDEAGGVMILAHPYRRTLHSDDDIYDAVEQCCRKPFFSFVDIIEVLNGNGSERENKFSQELCRRLNLNGVGSSDAHVTSDIPSCATLFKRKIRNLEELITELKAGRFRVVDLRHDS